MTTGIVVDRCLVMAWLGEFRKKGGCAALAVLLSLIPLVSICEPLSVDTPLLSLSVDVTSFSESRFLTTVKQRYDYSCGSAAVATLLSHHYENRVSEAEAFKSMYENGDRSVIRKLGFSLLDIKNYLKSKGYKADGYRISLEKLVRVGVPAIVLINDGGYKHFVVIKGVDGEAVLIGDPARGTMYLRRHEFEKMWNGIIFLIRTNKDVGSRNFQSYDKYDAVAKSPMSSVLDRRIEFEAMPLLLNRFEF